LLSHRICQVIRLQELAQPALSVEAEAAAVLKQFSASAVIPLARRARPRLKWTCADPGLSFTAFRKQAMAASSFPFA
jgi:hypothetical protein